MLRKLVPVFTSSTVLVFGLSTAALADTSTVYTVKKGDTLYKIATWYGTTVQRIAQENHIANPDYILVGQQLHIPTSTQPAAKGVGSIPATNQSAAGVGRSAGTAQDVVKTAKSLLGKYPYVWGGSSPADGGFDCSGFVQYVYGKNGIALPRSAHDQAKVGTPVAANALQPGDLVFFVGTYQNQYANNVTHVAIYVGNNQMIEESSARNTAIITKLWGNPYWESHYWGAKRVIH